MANDLLEFQAQFHGSVRERLDQTTRELMRAKDALRREALKLSDARARMVMAQQAVDEIRARLRGQPAGRDVYVAILASLRVRKALAGERLR